MSHSVGQKLKIRRELLGLTLMESAEKLKIDFSLLAKIEKDQRSINDNLFPSIAKLYAMDETELRTWKLADKLFSWLKDEPNAEHALKIVLKKFSKNKGKS
jgi:transcriptional regulator with XRE-family HTH domain